jgi:hypothetical protein
MSWLLENRNRPYLKAETHNQFTLMDRFRALGFVPPELTRIEREQAERNKTKALRDEIALEISKRLAREKRDT